jgi:hypothetical protein
MYNLNVSESRVTIYENVLQRCSVLMSGSIDGMAELTTQGIQYGNTYGGAVSLYYGLKAFDSLVVQNVSSAFTNNNCSSSGITSSVGVAGNAYGGCLSVYVGGWKGYTQDNSNIGSLSLSAMQTDLSGNTISDCSARMNHQLSSAFSGNIYGGGMSLAVGAYSYSFGSNTISGSILVYNTSCTISNNTLTNCTASLVVQQKGGRSNSNVHGGGVSLAVGAHSYSVVGGSYVLGSTTVSATSYTMTKNTLTSCSATLSVHGQPSYSSANVYGGGMSIAVGVYSYSIKIDGRVIHNSAAGFSSSDGGNYVSGHTTVRRTNYTFSRNTLTGCSATSSYIGTGMSQGANAYGGSLSLFVGSHSYNNGNQDRPSNPDNFVSGSTTVSGTNYEITSNNITGSSALSSCTGEIVLGATDGSNVYGGGISLFIGAYSYARMRGSVFFSGSTSVSRASFTISNNMFSMCSATSLVSGGAGGANVYGGGMSLAVGAYSYSATATSNISGNTAVSVTNYTISSNTLTNCSAMSSFTDGGNSNGANAYGGGMSLAVGAYSFSSGIMGGGSDVSGNTAVSVTNYTISCNTLTYCSAMLSFTDGSSSNGANAYGGGMSLAVGAYSYSGNESSVSGNSAVSGTNYTISSNMLTNCSATSSVSGVGNSNGANAYGGGMSLAVGAYSYSSIICIARIACFRGINQVLGNTTVSDTSYTISSNELAGCVALSRTSGSSKGASAYGGALSIVHNSSFYPSNPSLVVHAIGVLSVMRLHNCSFWKCASMTSSESCASGASNAAGGAVFSLAPSVLVDVVSSNFSNSNAVVQCAASSSSSYSVGGGISIFQSGKINVLSTFFTGCFAQGVLQSANVFVSGGGLHVQASDSLFLQNCVIIDCSVLNAFSTFLQSGGGALATQNVSSVRISDSFFKNNTDSSSTGTIFLQQLIDSSAMNVVFDRSVVVVQPSITPALNVSCGADCSVFQQKNMKILFQDANLSSYSEDNSQQYSSSAILSLPCASVVHSDNSFLNCKFNFTDNAAILAPCNQQVATFSCAPCARPFEISLTSSILVLNNLHNITYLGEKVCLAAASSSIQQCPYGLAYCSTIVRVSLGFWANFSADGRLSSVTRCPPKYCGCRNIERYNSTSCQLEPPFSPGYQLNLRINDNLCNSNRTGVLCGGCKPGFTQSLDGYSCISNDVCLQNVGWTWAVTILGYVMYSIYITVSSLQASKLGLIKCLLFFGQMSTFAQLSAFGVQDAGPSSISTWLSRVLQFESITSLYSQTCYGTDIRAYAFTVMQLCGPAIVLIFSLLLTLVLKQARSFLQRHNIGVEFSILATCSHVILLIFSSVSTVAFKLVTCSTIAIGDSTEHVIFIDGSVKCFDERWKGFIAVVVVLCGFPFLFAVALRSKWLPQKVQTAVCGAYSDSRFYWGAVTLVFRLGMSIVFSTIRSIPSSSALIQCFLCVSMLVLLVRQKPYCSTYTHLFDVMCHAILVVQFGLVAIGTVSESLGFVPSENNLYFVSLNRAALANSLLRYNSQFFAWNFAV